MMSGKQQAIFRTLVKRAWETVMKARNWKFPDAATQRAARDAWYRSQLHEKFGVFTTKELSGRDDYAILCATFEEIVGDSIYWQMRAMGGKPAEQRRRLIHEIQELCRRHDLDENYARGIARQSLQVETTPLLDQLQPAQLLTVLKALRTYAARKGIAAV